MDRTWEEVKHGWSAEPVLRVLLSCRYTPLVKMPLVIICGFPCSGKTSVANALSKYFLQQSRDVVVISENDHVSCRNKVYADSQDEKRIRGILKSQVQQFLNKDKVVILDAMNYIKGYRYELYCVSKGCHTTQCTVLCDVARDVALAWNDAHRHYNTDVMQALMDRFEEPDSRKRWDNPLFHVRSLDDLDVGAICEALFERKPPPPNQSTQSQPLSSASFLHDLDRITQDIVNHLMSAQKLGEEGEIRVPSVEYPVNLPSRFPVAKLAQLRRQFISFMKARPQPQRAIPALFVQYLNSHLM
ncbi:unnamed protein product [Darwinula stevensoni]|uniref:Protein KTI12 homolog n=1 Tax=Darwinula stevensoni TaxID=69355 RepID=A0A7R9AA57_9CRUS|nr:unnamed protein product [Darwinula stevensoni]CAG0898072.1 unnamed protein product [Darwinula stevensoni]